MNILGLISQLIGIKTLRLTIIFTHFALFVLFLAFDLAVYVGSDGGHGDGLEVRFS